MLDTLATLELSASFHTERDARDNNYLRISGIGDCRRKLAYRTLWHREGRPELPCSSHLLSIFDIGHGIHLRMQERLGNTGPLKWVDSEPCIDGGKFGFTGHCEIPLISHTERLRGTCDALTRPLLRRTVPASLDGDHWEELETIEPLEQEHPDADRYIIDIKSITARRHKWTDWRGEERESLSPFEKLKEAKPEHISQASLYAWLTTQPGFETDRLSAPLTRMPQVMIVYVAKDLNPRYYEEHPEDYPESKSLLNAPYKIFTHTPSQPQIDVLLTKVRSVWEHLDRGELPSRDYHHTPQRVAYACVDCPFRQECYQKEGYFTEDAPEEPLRILYHRSRQLVD